MIPPLRSLPKGTLASVGMTYFFYSVARERRYYEFCSRSKTKSVGRQGKTKFSSTSECAHEDKELNYDIPINFVLLYPFQIFGAQKVRAGIRGVQHRLRGTQVESGAAGPQW